MPGLDDTDRRILELLADDARRSYRAIADDVDLSPPAVSDRVQRLRKEGVLQGFTVRLDRDRLAGARPVLVDLEVDPARADDVRAALEADDAVEAVLATADARVLAAARPPTDPGDWIRETVDTDAFRGLAIRPLSHIDWDPAAPAADLQRACDECGNTVTGEGRQATVGGTPHAFCCASCETRFRERYEELAEGA